MFVKQLELVLINHINVIRQTFNGAVGHEQIKPFGIMLFSYVDISHIRLSQKQLKIWAEALPGFFIKPPSIY
jgi:hypothetical protein